MAIQPTHSNVLQIEAFAHTHHRCMDKRRVRTTFMSEWPLSQTDSRFTFSKRNFRLIQRLSLHGGQGQSTSGSLPKPGGSCRALRRVPCKYEAVCEVLLIASRMILVNLWATEHVHEQRRPNIVKNNAFKNHAFSCCIAVSDLQRDKQDGTKNHNDDCIENRNTFPVWRLCSEIGA